MSDVCWLLECILLDDVFLLIMLSRDVVRLGGVFRLGMNKHP